MTESATIQVWAEDRAGAPHIRALTAVGWATDGSRLTPADAVGGEATLAGAVRSCIGSDGTDSVDAVHLTSVIAAAYPGARLSFHLACGGPVRRDEQAPRLIYQEVLLGAEGRCR